MNFLRNLIENISPKMFALILFGIGFWVIVGSLLQLIALSPELFSSEEVVNFW
ncbi:MAG: hypothetical protein ACRC2S_00400 [Waterburya sp.]